MRWTAPALASLRELAERIAETSPAAADRIIARIFASVAHLVDHPEMGRSGRVGGTRELIIDNGRRIIVYRVQGPEVIIMAVLDTRQQWPMSFDDDA